MWCVSESENNFVELNGPCAGYKPGEDDLQAFDFIRNFALDLPETQYPGVTRVRGSNRMQTAYRLNANADLQLPTRLHSPPPFSNPSFFSLTLSQRRLQRTNIYFSFETRSAYIALLQK